MAMVFVPYGYYHHGEAIASFFDISLPFFLWLLFLLILFLEIIRLITKFQIFGQRSYERVRVSAFAWGALSLLLVLIGSPQPYGYPIIAACALGDPLVGELRLRSIRPLYVVAIGFIFILMIWLLAWYYLQTPWWWGLIMAPITVAVEWPQLKWIDDNALMQLVPLTLYLLYDNLIIGG